MELNFMKITILPLLAMLFLAGCGSDSQNVEVSAAPSTFTITSASIYKCASNGLCLYTCVIKKKKESTNGYTYFFFKDRIGKFSPGDVVTLIVVPEPEANGLKIPVDKNPQ
jgi:hypothetical protein